ncbi:HGGxSTG domain-containing protein, partial [Lacticaseibacillus paracasei]
MPRHPPHHRHPAQPDCAPSTPQRPATLLTRQPRKQNPLNTVQSGLPLERHQCGAKTRAGTPCNRWPPPGATRCRLHGGATPRSKAAAARRIAQAEA